MKVARITMKPCKLLQNIKPKNYIGFKVNHEGMVEHYIECINGSKRRLKVNCYNCFLGRVLEYSYLISIPKIIATNNGISIRFFTLYNARVRELLREFRDQIIDLVIDDYRNYYLTPRQLQILQLLGDDRKSISNIAKSMGISKTAASKLLDKALRKIIKKYA